MKNKLTDQEIISKPWWVRSKIEMLTREVKQALETIEMLKSERDGFREQLVAETELMLSMAEKCGLLEIKIDKLNKQMVRRKSKKAATRGQ